MKRLFLFVLLFPLFALAQNATTLVLNADSLKKNHLYPLDDNWKFTETDKPEMSDPDFNDSGWITVDPGFRLNSESTLRNNKFNSVGWFRLHFFADTSVTNIPLAFSVTHYGASQIYLDGKLLKTYGTIKGKDSSEYYDPQQVPFTFVLHKTGMHILAIRYANYNALRNYRLYKCSFTGFNLYVGYADHHIINAIENLRQYSFFPTLLFGIFITLSVLHLLLFFYYRSVKSNLYFSIFCFCLGLTFYLFYINKTDSNPGINKLNMYATYIIAALSCFSLSGLSNELFSRKKLRFRIITILCLLAPVPLTFNSTVGVPLLVSLFAFVVVEAFALTISAMIRKVKGAKIVGVGILFFSIFMLSMFLRAIVTHELSFSEGIEAEIFLYSAFFAVLSIPVSMSVYLSWNFAAINKDLKKHLEQVEDLSRKNREQELEKQQILERQKDALEIEVAIRTEEVVKQKEKIEKQHDELKTEKRKSDDLLLNILPEEIAEELKQTGISKARYFDEVTVLFTDFVDFTSAAERMTPEGLVAELDACFKAFDNIISGFNIEKIKTIGDAYLAVCGLPESDADHAEKIACAALQIVAFMQDRRARLNDKTFEVRVGIHTGCVVAGIVGVKKFAYDIWGDTVNTAARMEQNSAPGMINISQTTFDRIKDKFECTYRGVVQAKNKGELNMYFVHSAL